MKTYTEKDFFKIVRALEKLASKKNLAGMKRFGIRGKNMLGVTTTDLRKLARAVPRSHFLGVKFWNTGIHEARLLATMIDEVEKVSEKRMDQMITVFDSWDIVDQTCMNLFWQHPAAFKKARQWIGRKKEYEKRAGFALVAVLAWKFKGPDKKLYGFFKEIKKHSADNRKMVKKAVNWALRQIGKRNNVSRRKALKISREIATINSKAARWIAVDAIRELNSKQVIKRLKINTQKHGRKI